MTNNDDLFPPGWDPDPEDIKALALERSVRPSESNPETAQRLFEESAPMAATEIIRLATNRQANERVRLDAAKYVVERALGKLGENVKPAQQNPWDDVFKVMAKDVEDHANKA
jgi:hypothetical protein